MTRHLPRTLFVVALSSALCGPAFAQEAGAAVAADALFTEGRELAEQKEYRKACDRFARSQALVPSVGKLLNLGECHERLGELATAWGAYKQARTMALISRDSRSDVAALAAAALEPHVPRLVIVLDAPVAGQVVMRNGVAVDNVTLDVPVPVDPGSYAITSTAPGRRRWSGLVDVRPGTSNTVRVPSLERELLVVDEHRRDTERPFVYGLVIVGGTSVLAGLAMGAVALGKWSSVNDACPAARCPSNAIRAQRRGDARDASTFAALSTIGFAAGSAAIAAGLLLRFTMAKHTTTIVPAMSAKDVGLSASWDL